MYPEYLGKPKEVPIKYDLAISSSLSIHSSYYSQLMFDGIDWWLDITCSESVWCITSTKTLASLNASIILCILGITTMMLVSLGPTAPLNARIIPCIPRIMAMMLASFGLIALLSISIITEIIIDNKPMKLCNLTSTTRVSFHYLVSLYSHLFH